MNVKSAYHRASSCTGQHKTGKHEHTSMPGVGIEPKVPVFERSKMTCILDRAATGAGCMFVRST